MKNRVYGIIGVKSVMSNWNADFTGRPKTIGNGVVFGSDKALKYTIKKFWENQGLKVLYIKSFKMEQKGDEKEKIQPRDLGERYQHLFDKELDSNISQIEVMKDIFTTLDVMCFGATFATQKETNLLEESDEENAIDKKDSRKKKKKKKGINISITGAVQVGQGFNKYDNTRIEVQDILSPFRNSNEKSENAEASTLGTKVMSDEAHYFYPFTVNPENYNCYLDMDIEGFTGYTKDAYDAFKEASLVGATALNTNSKMGCENEFTLFIECKDESKLYLPDLAQYVKFSKVDDDKDIIDITGLDFIEKFDSEIKLIEVYYNPHFTNVLSGLGKIKKYNIYTKDEIL